MAIGTVPQDQGLQLQHTLHRHQAFTNTAKTAVLLSVLGAALIGAGSLIGSTTGAFLGLALACLMIGGSYWFSDRLAIRAAGAKPITETDAPNVYRIVRRLTERAGMPMPAIYLSPAQQPNAFATGRNPQHAAVCVTAGILPLLDDDELEGVLAHELSHVANRDILIGSIAAALAMGITMVARMAMWGSMFGGGRRRNSGPLGAIGLLAMMVLAPLAAMLVQMGISRSREFEADHSGAVLVGDGAPLARALLKIESAAARTPMAIDAAHATAYIVNPLTGRQVDFAGMFRTHPATAQRVERLIAIHDGGQS
jgi:heat shock protein HtpX